MLKETLAAHNITLSQLGAAVKQTGGRYQGRGFGAAAIANIVNHGRFPKTTPEPDVKQQIEAFLATRGVPPQTINGLWTAEAPAAQGTEEQNEDLMLPPKTTLSKQAMAHFNLGKIDPFGDIEQDGQFYESAHVRTVREHILSAMRTGGFVALVGESGAGKTEMIRECEEKIRAMQENICIIRPHITGMDVDSNKGSPLRARSVMLAILDAVAPNARRYAEVPRLSAEVERQLGTRYGDGEGKQRFVVVIGDAHRLHPSTLKHLKDLYELRLGRKRLLGIVLEGQLPLGQRLDPFDEEFVQITQRCEVIYLRPMGGEFALSRQQEVERKIPDEVLTKEIREYIDHRLTVTGRKAGEVFAPDAYLAIRERLAGVRKGKRINLAHPLALNNLLARALNFAAEAGDDRVGADYVREA